MIEFLKHTFGLCGEGHPNLLLLAATGLTPIAFYSKRIMYWVKSKSK